MELEKLLHAHACVGPTVARLSSSQYAEAQVVRAVAEVRLGLDWLLESQASH